MKGTKLYKSMPFPESERYLSHGPFIIDLHSHHTTINNRFVAVPPCAFQFLVTLLRHAPEPVSFKTLVSESQNERMGQLEAQDLARLNIYMLRRAIEPNIEKPRYIKTVEGYGYRLVF